MDRFIINGGKPLNGSVEISGAKNAALPLMVAALLAPGKTTLHNVPRLNDILFLKQVLEYLGVEIDYVNNHTMHLNVPEEFQTEAPYDIVRKMRASVYVLGPMIARMKKAKVSLPGGCAIGPRPIDLHLKGFEALGTKVSIEHGYILAETKGLQGSEVFLEGAFGTSVGATCNILMAAVLAQGQTTIIGAAQEPEVVDLANFLIAMGAQISGIGTSSLTIVGVDSLKPVEYTVIPDRIEAGTFMIAAAITRGKVRLNRCNHKHMDVVINKLRQIGLSMNISSDSIVVDGQGFIPSPLDLTTRTYPGFPTDMQAQMMSLLCLADGNSTIKENIYPERFMHVSELQRMGASIKVIDNNATITGVKNLSGAPIMASDLRASAALVLAAMAAQGETEILRIYHIDRGYDKIEKKLQQLGADIQRTRP